MSARPTEGFAHYLRDMVYGALDGVITTLAVISGASGASLEPRVALRLGMANLVADGISMGASNYLGLKSELQQRGASIRKEKPWRHGLATSAAFAVVGSLPLWAFLLAPMLDLPVLATAAALSVLALGLAGTIRGKLANRRPSHAAFEMVAIGLAASAAAYLIGALVEPLTRA